MSIATAFGDSVSLVATAAITVSTSTLYSYV